MAKVSLRVDGAEVATATADASGKFVAIFTLPQAGAGRLMTLIATLPDGTMVEARTVVALMGTAAPPAPATSTATASTATANSATASTGTTATPPATATTSAANSTAPNTPANTPANTSVPTTIAPTTTAANTPAPNTTAPTTTPPTAAPNTTAALVVTDQGAKVLQPTTAAPPGVAGNVTLETITYPSGTEVQFGGRGAPGAHVRLYLNTVALGDPVAIAADGTWAETQTGITPGLYTLRVDQLDGSGKVTSRYESPFKRETAQALAAASGMVKAPDAALTAADSTAPATSTAATAPATTAPVTVTVQPGYTLWGIAKRQMGDGIMYVQVFAANKTKIKNPDLIYPGQVFTMPQN